MAKIKKYGWILIIKRMGTEDLNKKKLQKLTIQNKENKANTILTSYRIMNKVWILRKAILIKTSSSDFYLINLNK